MRSQFRILVVCLFSLFLPAGLIAQGKLATNARDGYPIDIAISYSAQHSNLVSTPTFWQSGGSADVTLPIYRGLSAVAKLAGSKTGDAANSGHGLSLITANFGPRYTYYLPLGIERKQKFAVFGQALIGPAWGFNSYFPAPSGSKTSEISFCLRLGGGADVALSRHLGVRPFQAEWLRTQFPNGNTNVQNNFQLGAGVVFRF